MSTGKAGQISGVDRQDRGKPGLTAGERDEIAELLRQAEARRVAIKPVTDKYPQMTVHDAYLVQLINIPPGWAQGRRWVATRWGSRPRRCRK